LSLNKEQLQAVTYDKGPLLVSAGPGSGKTRVITERVAFLLKKKKLEPTQILCLTFTEAGAETMKNRLAEMKIDTTDIQISTYHSFCSNILRDYTHLGSAKIVKRSSFLVWALDNIDSFKFDHWLDIKNIKSTSNTAELIEKLIDGISTFKDELITPEEITRYVRNALANPPKNIDIEQIQQLHELDNLVKIYKKYDDYKRKQGILDFDDLIVLTNELLSDPKKKHILNHLQDTYKHILIDEFQDNNFAQFSIIKKLVTKGNITAVGDDDQSIYRFQGAYPEIFKDFMKSFKGAKIILLKKNYRNIKSVVELSSALLRQDATRQIKKLESTKKSKEKVSVMECEGEFAQAEFVKRKIIELRKKNRKLTFGDFAVLSRKQRDGMIVANLLTSSGIPVNYVGKSNIFNSPSARNLISYLSVIADPSNSGKYINQILDVHGVPETDIATINHEAKTRAWNKHGDCVLDVLSDLKLQKIKRENYGKVTIVQPKLVNIKQIRSVYSLLRELIQASKKGSTSRTINEVLRVHTDIFKKTTYEDTFENYIERSILIDLQSNANDLQTLKPDATVNDFLKYIETLESFEVETEQGGEFTDYVQISTIHQSKGKEFKYVFVIGVGNRQVPLDFRKKMFYVPKDLAKGLYPAVDQKTIFTNEERRVLYVGMTRAIDNLFVTWSNTVASSGNYRECSTFLVDLSKKQAWNKNVRENIFGKKLGHSAPPSANPIDFVKNEMVDIAVKNISTGQYESAVQTLVDLDAIKHYKSNKTTKGAKLTKNLKMKPSSTVEKRLKGIKVGGINISSLSLSASKFGNYDKCPKQFKFQYLWKVPSAGTSIALYKGNVFHGIVEKAGFEQKKGRMMSKKELEKLFSDRWDYREFLDHSKKDEREGRTNVKYMLGEYEKWAKSRPKNKVIDTERKFKIKIGGVEVNGKIDRVEQTPTGDIIVYDYKTGMSQDTIAAKRDIQLNVYCLACLKLYKKLPKYAILFYPLIPDNHPSKKRFRVYNVTTKDVKAGKEKLEELVKQIKSLDFTAKPDARKCKWCDYRNICVEAK